MGKSGQRLVTDGTKYVSQLIGNRMFSTIVKCPQLTNDKDYYQCMLQILVYQRRQASVYLTVNNTRIVGNTRLTKGACYF